MSTVRQYFVLLLFISTMIGRGYVPVDLDQWPPFVLWNIEISPSQQDGRYEVFVDLSTASGVDASEIRVFFDEKPITPSQVTRVSPPRSWSILLLIDQTPSMSRGTPPKNVLLQQGLRQFLRMVSAQPDTFLLWTFHETTEPLHDVFSPATDLETILPSLQPDLNAQKACLYDAIIAALQRLQASNVPSSPVLIIITDGDDNLLHSQEGRCSRATREEVIAKASAARIPIFALLLPPADDATMFPGFIDFMKTLTQGHLGATRILSNANQIQVALEQLFLYFPLQNRLQFEIAGSPGSSHALLVQYREYSVGPFPITLPPTYSLQIIEKGRDSRGLYLQIQIRILPAEAHINARSVAKIQIIDEAQNLLTEEEPPVDTLLIPAERLPEDGHIIVQALDDQGQVLASASYEIPAWEPSPTAVIRPEQPAQEQEKERPRPLSSLSQPPETVASQPTVSPPSRRSPSMFLTCTVSLFSFLIVILFGLWFLYQRGLLPLSVAGATRIYLHNIAKANGEHLPSSTGIPEAYLQIIDSAEPAYVGRRILLRRPIITLGRTFLNDIPFPRDILQDQHLRIVYQDGLFLVQSIHDAPFTINGQMMSEAVLHTGDEIQIGERFRLRFFFPSEDRTHPWPTH